MKCELKLIKKTFFEYIKDTLAHPMENRTLIIKSLWIAVPTITLNELLTPHTDYICYSALIICFIIVYILIHERCKKNKGI